MIDARSLYLDELRQALEELGEPRYRGEQLFRWIHKRGATSFKEMTNVARAAQERLAEVVDLTPLEVEKVRTASDGTRKLLLRATDGEHLEAVLIPDRDKLTLCLSTQVGCALGCRFCATATMGLRRHLRASEIVDQLYRARALAGERITHVVYMGMGEPLHNYDNTVRSLQLLSHDLGASLSSRRITVSTAGLVPGIERLGKEPLQVNLAVSLNATTDEVRRRLMPIARRYPLAQLMAAIRAYPLQKRRRVTFEYVMLRGVNDSDLDLRRLVKLLHGIPAKVNLIPWNPYPGLEVPGLELRRPDPAQVLHFQDTLKSRGVAAYLRTTRGDDIAAACGQLAAPATGPAPESPPLPW